jgi:fibrillarin-like pre-rRNA processing protein
MTNIEIRNHPKFYNVFISGPKERLKLYTINSDPGNRVYGEKLIFYRGIEYREWDPFRSKLAALLLENPISNFFTEGLNKGIIYGVEFAERSIRQLIQNISRRVNIIPILADARDPTNYAKSVFTNIDLIYQDISQPNQAEIAVSNCNYYLKDTGLLILVIKSQSIDSVQKSAVIYEQEKVIMEKSGYSVLESVNIHKYAANHIILIVKRRSI